MPESKIEILSPEEVAAKSSMPDISEAKSTGEISAENPTQPTEEEMRAVVEKMQLQAAEASKKISDALESSGAGTYMLIRFENPISLRHVVTFSEGRPAQQAIIAVLHQILSQIEAYQMRDYWKQADQIDQAEAAKEDRKVRIATAADMAGLPRAQRRKLFFGK
jgi:hypothetical protein